MLRRLLILCALLAAPTILLAPALPAGRALLPADLLVQFEPWRSHLALPPLSHWDPLVWDGIAQYYPWRLFAAESLRSGRLPLWNPFQFCGTPFLANGQSAVLYPPNLVFLLLPVARGFGASAWLHLALTGWFAYLFGRRIGIGRAGAICAAIVWQANGFSVAWLHLPTLLCTASWLPLVLLCCDRALVRRRARYAPAAGAALALSYLGGHPQIFLFVVLLTGGYLAARALSRGDGPTLGRRALTVAVTAAIAGVVALGLAAAQLLSTLDLLRIAHRASPAGPEGYAAYLGRALPLPLLWNLVLPHPLGHPARGTYVGPENYADYCSYVGVVALPLVLYAALRWRGWHARFFALAGLLALLAALGTPVNWPLYHWVPAMSSAGGPSRMVLLVAFCFSVLAGMGVDALPRPRERKGTARAGLALVLLGIIAGAVGVWWAIGGTAADRGEAGVMAEVGAEAPRALVLLVAAAGLILACRRPSLRRVCGGGLAIILAADLLLAAQHHVHAVPLEWVYSEKAGPGAVAGRVLGNAADWPLGRFPRAVLPPNAATVYHLRDAFGYDSLYLAQYRDFAALIQGEDPSPPLNGNLLLARLRPAYGLDMLSLASVSTVLSPGPVRGLELDRAGAFDTYHNPYAFPRAWVTDSAVFVPSRQEAVAAMVRLGATQDLLVVTGPYQEAARRPASVSPSVRVRNLSANEVAVDLPQGGGGYLFLADSHAPGWHAYSDEQAVPVLIADVAFRAVAPPREAESVVFRYEPDSFRVGLFVSLLALAGLAGGVSCCLVIGRR